MTYISVAGLRWPNLLAAALLCLALVACDSGSSGGGDGGGGMGGTDGPRGCLVTNFSGEPDVLVFPLPASELAPGSTVNFNIFVDSDTRLAKSTFRGAYHLDPTANPQAPSDPQVQNTAGNTTLDFAIPVNRTGRYYVEMELCGSNCDELRIVYTLDRALAGEVAPGDDALAPINNPYERIVYRGGVESSSSHTCDKPRSVAMQ